MVQFEYFFLLNITCNSTEKEPLSNTSCPGFVSNSVKRAAFPHRCFWRTGNLWWDGERYLDTQNSPKIPKPTGWNGNIWRCYFDCCANTTKLDRKQQDERTNCVTASLWSIQIQRGGKLWTTVSKEYRYSQSPFTEVEHWYHTANILHPNWFWSFLPEKMIKYFPD